MCNVAVNHTELWSSFLFYTLKYGFHKELRYMSGEITSGVLNLKRCSLGTEMHAAM
jgi:hypothetical protein